MDSAQVVQLRDAVSVTYTTIYILGQYIVTL